MSHSSYDSVKEQIREAIDIVELVSRFIPLSPSGRHYVGRCPWHDDSRPSLQVNQVRQSYKCWVCNIGGDIFSFIMQMEKVDFREAVEILADIAGIELKRFKEQKYTKPKMSSDHTIDPNDMLLEAVDYDDQLQTESQEPVVHSIDKKTIYRALDWVQKQYHEALLTLKEAAQAREYLQERGINEQSIRQFALGYVPLDREWLLKKINKAPRRIECLVAAGVLGESQFETDGTKKKYYDRFRGRLMFPIRDTQDRTIAFGGRIIVDDPEKRKYVNSPETVLFKKSKLMYGLDIARHTMTNSGRAIITEGYTDCIMAHQMGLTDTIAILGTALGSEHVQILKNLVKKMYLVLDGDVAGQTRTNAVLDMFIAQGVDIAILTLPAGADPCEFLLENGKDEFERLLKNESVDIMDHAFNTVTAGIDLKDDIVGSTQALDKLLKIVAETPTELAKPEDPVSLRLEKTLNRLSSRFGIAETKLRTRLKQLRDKKRNAVVYDYDSDDESEIKRIAPELMPDPLEIELLSLCFADPSTFNEFEQLVPDEWIISPITKRIQKRWKSIIEESGNCNFEKLLISFDEPELKNLMVEIDESASEKGVTAKMDGEKRKRMITEIVQGFTRRDIKRRTPQHIGELKDENLTREEKRNKLLEILKQKRTESSG